MTSTEVSSPPRKHAGASVIVGFLPWIIYWILSGNTKISTAVLVALVLSVVNNANQYRRDHELIALEAGTTVWFALALVLSYTVSDDWLLRWMSPLSNLAFFAVMLFTAVIRKPFTVQYAKQSTPPEIWDTPGFMYVNWTLTWVWIGSTALMTVISVVPSIVDSNASLTSADPLNVACYWVLPYGLLGLTVVFTARFPDWFSAAFDEVDAASEPPPAPPIPVDGGDGRRSAEGGLGLAVEPRETLLDEVPTVTVTGAGAGQEVTVTATAVDAVGHTWRSEATVRADDAGRVEVAADDAARLLWSMTFATPGATPDIFVPSTGPLGVSVEASSGGRTASTVLVRSALPPGATVQDVRADGVVGRLFLPAVGGGDGGAGGPGDALSGVVLVAGSEGGLDSMATDAALLAAHGRAALVLGLFGAPGLDDTLSTIPLERLQAGVRWLAGHPSVDPSRLGALAISRGAEALLSAAARLDLPLTDVVAISPSSVVWPAETDSGASPDTSAWTVGGDQLAFVPVDQEPILRDMGRQALAARGRAHRHKPPVMHLARAYGASLDEASADTLAAARIPVERIAARLLLVVGTDDQVWPSGRMASDLAAQRGSKGGRDERLDLDGCGHLVRLGILPTDVAWTGGIALGGTPASIAAGQRRTTDAVLSWLP